MNIDADIGVNTASVFANYQTIVSCGISNKAWRHEQQQSNDVTPFRPSWSENHAQHRSGAREAISSNSTCSATQREGT